MPISDRYSAQGLTRIALGVGALVAGLAACSKDVASGGEGARTASAAEAKGAARGGPGGAGGSRRPSSLVIAATDVAVVSRGEIEAAMPISGDLRPIETVDVRARLEGDLASVSVREGQHVSAGALLARFEPSAQESDRASAEADLASARTELSTAQWNADQSQELFKAGAIPERDLRTAQQLVASSRARVAAATAKLRSSSIVARDTRVVAPTTGVVEKRLVEPGEHLARGAQMFTVVRNDVLELAAAVPSRQASVVRPGQLVHFDADGRRFDGKVARVSPTVDPVSRSVTVYVNVPNPGGQLRGNTFASGRVVSRTLGDAILAPISAIRQAPEDGKPYVFRIANDKVERAPVQVGVTDEAQGIAEITSGLEPGDRIISGNVGAVGNGMKVQVIGGGDRQAGSGERGAPSTGGARTPRPAGKATP